MQKLKKSWKNYLSRSLTAVHCLNSDVNVKAVVAAFNQEKALVGAFSVITNLRMDFFEAQPANPGRSCSAAGG